MGNFGFVIVGVIALDIFIWVWLIISDKKTLTHYDFLPRTKESLDAEVRDAIVKIDTNNSSHCRYCGDRKYTEGKRTEGAGRGLPAVCQNGSQSGEHEDGK